MRPLIFKGVCYVAIVPVDVPQVGDILLFEQIRRGGTSCVLHRLVDVEDGVYVTRGDNCLGCERITRADIIGRVENIYWPQGSRSSWSLLLWLPRLYGARNEDNRWVLNANDSGYLRYVSFWNAVWPLRRIAYMARAVAARIYHAIVS